MMASAMGRVVTVISYAFFVYARDLGRAALIILVIAAAFFGQGGVQRVMQVVRPVRVHADAAVVRRQNHSRIVHIRFGDKSKRSPGLFLRGGSYVGKFFDEGQWR